MRDIFTSPRILSMRRKRRKYLWRLSILLSILFIAIVSACAYFSFDERIVINKISVNGNKIINTSDIEEIINNKISGKYLYLFNRANIFIYPKHGIYRELISKYPRIESLSIYKTGLNTLSLDIKERNGAYLYCGDKISEVKSEIGENCYFVNNDGYVFDKAPYFSGNVYLKFYVSISDTDPLKKQILPVDRFRDLLGFIDGVTSLGFRAAYLFIDQDGMHSLYLEHGEGKSNPKIIFREENDLGVILENLSSSMKKKEFANEINSKYDTLLYIDLRFKNKVLYKFL